MDTKRLVLFVVFSFSLLMLWEAWQKEQRLTAPVAPTSQSIPSPSAGASGGSIPSSTGGATQKPAVAIPSANTANAAHERIKIETDVLLAEVDTLGGDIVRLELLKHPDTVDHTKNLVLIGPEHEYSVQSGLIGDGLPNHKTVYRAASKQLTLNNGEDKIEIRLEADGAAPVAGVKTAKIITFHRSSYLIDVTHEITNSSGAVMAPNAYFQIVRDGVAPAGDPRMVTTYTGTAVYTEQDKFLKVPFKDIDKASTPISKSADNGWVAMVQHYFVSALLPPAKLSREFYARKLSDKLYSVGAIVPMGNIAPGATASITVPLYSGPEEQDKLKTIAPGLELVVDYGWLTIISVPLFWVLQYFHGWFGNWGLAIIFLTISIKLIFFPLSAASYKSMAKMKLVAPRLTKIREMYADDRMKQNQAMMDLYKEEKINPLGGCLPIVIQIPVFIALYWTLLASVELRYAPFYGWITDLSTQDPYFVLPALMMISMIIQTKLNPTPPDPIQAKVMMIMPLAFGVMFFFFPAGLVLYWLVNNILSILQQWQITRMIEGARAESVPKR
jgi:YidC/Oxa1 family membrane protein insertase